MRTREEIQQNREDMLGIDDYRILLEVLLDIRDILQTKDKPNE